MPTGMRPFTDSLLILALFALFIMTFTYQFIHQQNPDSDILNETKYGISRSANSMNTTISSVKSIGNNIQNQMTNSTIGGLSIFLIFDAAFHIPLTLWGLYSSMIAAFSSMLFPGLTGTWSSVVNVTIGVIFTSLIIRGIFLAIKAIRTGESER